MNSYTQIYRNCIFMSGFLSSYVLSSCEYEPESGISIGVCIDPQRSSRRSIRSINVLGVMDITGESEGNRPRLNVKLLKDVV